MDRRALDPPPVVQLKLYRIFDAGTMSESQQEIDYKQVQKTCPLECALTLRQFHSKVENLGLVCHVDLFPAQRSMTQMPASQDMEQQLIRAQPSSSASKEIAGPSGHLDGSIWPGYQGPNPHESQCFCSDPTQCQVCRRVHDDMITRKGGSYADTEAANRTDALVGDLFVQPVTIDYQGRPAIVFAFPVGVLIQLPQYLIWP